MSLVANPAEDKWKTQSRSLLRFIMLGHLQLDVAELDDRHDKRFLSADYPPQLIIDKLTPIGCDNDFVSFIHSWMNCGRFHFYFVYRSGHKFHKVKSK